MVVIAHCIIMSDLEEGGRGVDRNLDFLSETMKMTYLQERTTLMSSSLCFTTTIHSQSITSSVSNQKSTPSTIAMAVTLPAIHLSITEEAAVAMLRGGAADEEASSTVSEIFSRLSAAA